MPDERAALEELWKIVREGNRSRFDDACEYIAENVRQASIPSKRYRETMERARKGDQDWTRQRCPRCGAKFVGFECGYCRREAVVSQRGGSEKEREGRRKVDESDVERVSV